MISVEGALKIFRHGMALYFGSVIHIGILMSEVTCLVIPFVFDWMLSKYTEKIKFFPDGIFGPGWLNYFIEYGVYFDKNTIAVKRHDL